MSYFTGIGKHMETLESHAFIWHKIGADIL